MEVHGPGPPERRVLGECRLPPDPASVPAARALVRGLLPEWPADVVDTAELLACELATNAVLHAGTPFELRLLARRGGTVRVEVSDDAGALAPVLDAHSPGITSAGRGLTLVDDLASAWGTAGAAAGKTVWLEIAGRSAD